MVTFEKQVEFLYEVAFNRPADKEGLKLHVDLLKSGASLLSLAQAFAGSAEFQERYKYASDEFMIARDMLWNGVERTISKDTGEGRLWLDYLSGKDAGTALYTIAASVEIVGSDVTWEL